MKRHAERKRIDDRTTAFVILGVTREDRFVVDCCVCCFEKWLNVRELDSFQHRATQAFAADGDSENKSRKCFASSRARARIRIRPTAYENVSSESSGIVQLGDSRLRKEQY